MPQQWHGLQERPSTSMPVPCELWPRLGQSRQSANGTLPWSMTPLPLGQYWQQSNSVPNWSLSLSSTWALQGLSPRHPGSLIPPKTGVTWTNEPCAPWPGPSSVQGTWPFWRSPSSPCATFSESARQLPSSPPTWSTHRCGIPGGRQVTAGSKGNPPLMCVRGPDGSGGGQWRGELEAKMGERWGTRGLGSSVKRSWKPVSSTSCEIRSRHNSLSTCAEGGGLLSCFPSGKQSQKLPISVSGTPCKRQGSMPPRTTPCFSSRHGVVVEVESLHASGEAEKDPPQMYMKL